MANGLGVCKKKLECVFKRERKTETDHNADVSILCIFKLCMCSCVSVCVTKCSWCMGLNYFTQLHRKWLFFKPVLWHWEMAETLHCRAIHSHCAVANHCIKTGYFQMRMHMVLHDKLSRLFSSSGILSIRYRFSIKYIQRSIRVIFLIAMCSHDLHAHMPFLGH